MNKRKEKFPTAWLSKQQKEILKIVSKSNRPVVRTRNISKDVAEKFNVDGSRALIRSSRKEKIEEIGEKVKSGKMPSGQASDFINLWTILRKRDKTNFLLKNKHSASVSRSLKRLTERDLIVPYNSVQYSAYFDKKDRWVDGIIGTIKATKKYHNKPLYALSEKGIDWCNSNVKNFDDTKAKRLIKEDKVREKRREARDKERALKRKKKK